MSKRKKRKKRGLKVANDVEEGRSGMPMAVTTAVDAFTDEPQVETVEVQKPEPEVEETTVVNPLPSESVVITETVEPGNGNRNVRIKKTDGTKVTMDQEDWEDIQEFKDDLGNVLMGLPAIKRQKSLNSQLAEALVS